MISPTLLVGCTPSFYRLASCRTSTRLRCPISSRQWGGPSRNLSRTCSSAHSISYSHRELLDPRLHLGARPHSRNECSPHALTGPQGRFYAPSILLVACLRKTRSWRPSWRRTTAPWTGYIVRTSTTRSSAIHSRRRSGSCTFFGKPTSTRASEQRPKNYRLLCDRSKCLVGQLMHFVVLVYYSMRNTTRTWQGTKGWG